MKYGAIAVLFFAKFLSVIAIAGGAVSENGSKECTEKKPLSLRPVFEKPIWCCHDLNLDSSKRYILNIYKRKGDQRFQFVLEQVKPVHKVLFDFAENMESTNPKVPPSKTAASKAIFSFSLDTEHKLSTGEYSGRLVIDNSHSLKNKFVFSETNPLLISCRQ